MEMGTVMYVENTSFSLEGESISPNILDARSSRRVPGSLTISPGPRPAFHTYRSMPLPSEPHPEFLRVKMIEAPIQTIYSLKRAVDIAAQWRGEEVRSFLRRFADEVAMEFIEKVADSRKLAGLLLWVERRYQYGQPLLNPVFDEETGEFQFIALILPDCDWETWKRIAKEIKSEMREAGLRNLTSKVAVICLQGL
ncbi:MAG: hypothetical protein DRK00_08585 [Thermoprotei archaeon]|nr:MAG: hypothetical protein DRK00_08585 [Thermoprotei archaeon]